MNWLMNMTLSKKIMGGYLVLALILAATVALTLNMIASNQTLNNRVFELRAPTVLTTEKVLGAMQESLAGLRGWMILGKDKFKTDRAHAWKTIDENYGKLQVFSEKWTNPENVRRLKEAGAILDEFKKAQEEIEAISGTLDNTPATKILVEDAAPRANTMVAEITNIINMEANLAATKERKALLGMMADTRGTTARALANIRAFLLTGDQQFKDRFDVMWNKNIKRFAELKRNRSLLTSAQRVSFDKFDRARTEFLPFPQKMFEIRGSNEWNIANLWLGTKAAPRAGELIEIFSAMASNQGDLATADIELAQESGDNLSTELLIIGLFAFVIALVMAIVITRNVNQQLGKDPAELVAVTELMAKGDLSFKRDAQGTGVYASVCKSVEKMIEVIAGINSGAEEVSVAAEQVSMGNANLSQRTEEQASSLEETASSMEEMTSTVKQNADNAKQASQLAQTARDQAEAGGNIVSEAVTAMGEINSSSSKIADIISVVEEIAFQTNLLALNAAVEAARAGEQGRGFAVVASEVRVLAGRSADAAKEIKGLIEDSVEKVKKGSELVDKSGDTLREIVTGVKKVSDIVFEIAAASEEQSAGINQVNTAITQMDEMTQQNASVVEEATAASEAMSAQAQELQALISFFKLDASVLAGKRKAVKTIDHFQQVDNAVTARIGRVNKPKEVEQSKANKQVAVNSGEASWQDF